MCHSLSIETRTTPGIDATGVRTFCPSAMKIGQIRSSTVSVVSATSRRVQASRRLRRIRVVGNEPMPFAMFRVPQGLHTIFLLRPSGAKGGPSGALARPTAESPKVA
jgi:hypothetical protein